MSRWRHLALKKVSRFVINSSCHIMFIVTVLRLKPRYMLLLDFHGGYLIVVLLRGAGNNSIIHPDL